ncbi:splicing factor 3b subunit 2 [Anaeramoeba ignava]|uniref:Splicing factor 3b subunit 2 n=1 Tax=Anaeramoeba ignava TaxID=1746090 RepID=A0A9Q0RHQ4_ANAIG|nr:splicing factor 3b subunit 2 [Anaeramoeba ignava]
MENQFKLSRNQKRNLKRKLRRKKKQLQKKQQQNQNENQNEKENQNQNQNQNEKLETNNAKEEQNQNQNQNLNLEIFYNNPSFKNILEKFNQESLEENQEKNYKDKEDKMKENSDDESDDISDDNDDNNFDKLTDDEKISKKKLKKNFRLTIAELKQLVRKPEVVELHDTNSRDPRLLIYLKSYRNTVPVPPHWSQKRKYLQGKKGFLKPPFKLPHFIEATGISKIRQSLNEKDDSKTLKQKGREKIQPKMGTIEIDYQILHDAFFKYQTKPSLTKHGDLYYERKEQEMKYKSKRPGELSSRLKEALGMPEGAPPPWLIHMQRYGPPPSYPNLKIPGLNAPIPVGAKYGYHPGGWGKCPVDEFGRPLYGGDVFGNMPNQILDQNFDTGIEKIHWGVLEEEFVSESESESESEDIDEKKEDEEIEDQEQLKTEEEKQKQKQRTDLNPEVFEKGITSIPIGFETPDMINLRKGKIKDKENQEEEKKQKSSIQKEEPTLYTVLEEKNTKIGKELVGSSHVYEIPQIQKDDIIINKQFHQQKEIENLKEVEMIIEEKEKEKEKEKLDEKEKKKKKKKKKEKYDFKF